MRISDFRGVRLDKPAGALDSNEFQIDQGSDRLSTARWRRRRGMRRSNVPKAAAAVETLLGFEIPGDYALITAAGANAAGYAGVAEGPATAAAVATHSALTPNHRAHPTTLKRLGYLVNGWDKAIRWDGRSSAFVQAGISGPSTEIDSWTPDPVEAAGSGTPGVHTFRYRYLDSVTGYVSEASEEREVEITSGNGKLTFPIGNALSQVGPDAGTGFTFTATTIQRFDGGDWTTGGWQVGDYVTVANAADSNNDGTWGPITAVSTSTLTIASGGLTADTVDTTATFNNVVAYRIRPSTDSKVDKIVIEMTTVNGDVFYNALEVANTANTVAAVDISDPSLEVSFLEWPDSGHYPPPVAKYAVGFRERLWLFGQVVHSTGNCDVTNGSPDVGEGAVDPDWRASALGDSTAATPLYPDVAWFFQRDGDARAYEISTYDESLTKIILKENYAGITGTDVSYKIFSRANVCWISEPGYPEGFSSGGYLDGFETDLTAAVGAGSSMVFFGLSGMDLVSWDQGPLVDPVRRTISRQRGALNQRVVIEVDQTVYAMDRKGWHAWQGTVPQDIGRPIEAIRASIDYTYADDFSCVYLPELRAIRWFVTYTGDTYPKNYVQLDLSTGSWSTGVYYQGIAESKLVPSAEGLTVVYGDDQGYVWVADKGLADGVDEGTSRMRADSGASTTVIPVTEVPSLPTTGEGLDGCYLFHPASGEARRISSNTSSQITVGTAFSSAPTEGDLLWVGPIPSKLKTKAFRDQRLGRKRSPRSAWLEFTPLATGERIDSVTQYDTGQSAVNWVGVVWSSSLELFVAVASNGTYRVMTSPDGVVWTARSAAEDNLWLAVTWAESLGLFVAVAGDGTNRVMTSSDGITWTARSAAEANTWQAVAWSESSGLLVAVSSDGTNRVMTSSDGITWTARSAAEANHWRGVVWAESLGLFVAVAATGTNRVMTSPDGITWTARSAAEANNWWGVAWSPELGLLVSVASSGTNRVMTSSDGITWSSAGATEASNWRGVAWSGGQFVAVSGSGTDQIMRSLDGSTWLAVEESSPSGLTSIAWAPSLEVFVVVALASGDALLLTVGSDPRYLQVRVYDSLSSTAKSWSSQTGRNDPPGAQFPGSNAQYPTSDWLIDLSESDGNVRLNLGNEFRRYFEIELEINEPDAPLELLSLETEGWDLEDPQ